MDILKPKIKRFFENLSSIHHDRDLNQLLLYLEQESELTAITLPLFVEWIKQAVITWSATGLYVGPNAAHFVLDLAAILSKDEKRFCDLNSNNFFVKLVHVSKARQGVEESKLSYIKLLDAFLEHNSGIEWMVSCNFWEDILKLSVTSQNGLIVEKSTYFVAKMLEKTAIYDENVCDDVVKRIMSPLGENIYKSLKASSDLGDMNDRVASQYLKPTLKLIGTILEHFLEGIHLGCKDFKVLLVFLKNCYLEERISDFGMIAQIKSLVFDSAKITFTMQFLELYVKVAANSVSVNTINATVQRIRHDFILNTSKVSYEDFAQFCSFGQLFWVLIDTKISQSTKYFANELTVFLLFSHWCLLFRYCYEKQDLSEFQYDEFRERHLQKIYQLLCHDLIRIGYNWKDKLVLRPDIFKICIFCNELLIKSKKFFCRDRAIMVLRCFIYGLRDIISSVKECPRKLDYFRNEIRYFDQILLVSTELIEEHQITWRDILEAIDLVAIAFEFLKINKWPKCIVVQVLKLINVATAHYMAPDLALLLDSTTDSTIAVLGPLLYTKLHDEEEEVKCAGLDVVCTMARISSCKFPSLQKVLMDSELPTLVVKMSTYDGESYVRATAIKCLQEMIQVEEIWNNALKTEDLSQKMRDVLINETEGIVRVEAATFMCVAYEQQQFPKDTLDKIYETMIYSSTTDLHWEVKVRALGFWDKVIKNHLQNQGMIDGSFPNVTFSREHRKIVTLTDSEIRKRLHKVLGQLSAIGCLGVLMSAIKDDCDIEVSKTAVKITQRLVDLFKKYNVRSDCSAPTSPSPTENGMSATVSLSSGISVDESMDSPASSHPDFNEEIIEQIVTSKDVTLLKSVYAASDYGSVSNYDIQVKKIVTPNEFLVFTQQDLNAIIAEKKKWLNGIEDLGSLLDDMLKTYDDDVNNMDCY